MREGRVYMVGGGGGGGLLTWQGRNYLPVYVYSRGEMLTSTSPNCNAMEITMV